MYEKFGQFIDGKWQQAEKKENGTTRKSTSLVTSFIIKYIHPNLL